MGDIATFNIFVDYIRLSNAPSQYPDYVTYRAYWLTGYFIVGNFDFHLQDVTPENFLNILEGKAEAMSGIGSGKVIQRCVNPILYQQLWPLYHK